MSLLLAMPFEQEQVDAIRRRFPSFRGAVPEDAVYWSEEDLEQYFRSGGKVKPKESAKASGSTCPLLTRTRLRLAEDHVMEVTQEYLSFCRHLKEVGEGWWKQAKLSSVAECLEVPKAAAVPDGPLRSPLVVEKPRQWKARPWNMEYWRRECGLMKWRCRTRSPAFSGDAEGIDSFSISTTVEEYVDYVRTVMRVDRKCSEDNSLAFPRMSLDGLMPFADAARDVFEESWRDLGPPGIQDWTPRWAQTFSQIFTDVHWIEALAKLYKIQMGVTGSITRLHVEKAEANLWLNQIEGRRLFYLFPPRENKNLYEDAGKAMEEQAGWTTRVSPVDLFYPSQKLHPLLAESRAYVAMLFLGQTLVIPSGWWWYSVNLDASVTLCHPFWNFENRFHFAEGCREHFDYRNMRPEYKGDLNMKFSVLHQRVVDEADPGDSGAED